MPDDVKPGDPAGPDDAVPKRVERRSAFVAAPPQAIFDLLADPAKHHTFDGSGTVRESADDDPDRLAPGAKFGMKMNRFVPYRITNEVVEFDEPALIAWRHFGGHVWRYRLREVEGGTEVTEEFDWRTSRAPWLLQLLRYPDTNARALEETLARLAEMYGER